MKYACRTLLLGTLIHLLLGCAHPSPPLPSYHWIDGQTALDDLSRRAHAIHSISAEALLTLSRPDGSSIRLDGAVVISSPQKSVRLRAWKFDQPVFDLTLKPDGLWIETPREAPQDNRDLSANMTAAQLARGLALFDGEVFEGPSVTIRDSGGPDFQVSKPIADGQTMIAHVDRSSLTVLQYDLVGRDRKNHFSLLTTHYQDFKGILWPMHLTAKSDSGTIEVELHDVELNGELAAGAFVPPIHARKAQ